ncbi:MAG: EutN/CcmL family microcompartment protein [Planctomycetota bacterium]
MFLARVQGHVVATAKDPTIQGFKLLIVEPLKVDYDATKNTVDGKPAEITDAQLAVTGRAIVAMDLIGAGEGQLVLIVQGSSARMADGMSKTPTDAVVIGIVDSAVVGGTRIEA